MEKKKFFTIRRLISLGVAVVFFIIFIPACIASQRPQLFHMESKGSVKPGVNAFSAHGKLTFQYSCRSNTEKETTVEFSLVNTRASGPAATVWKIRLRCTTISEDPNSALSEAIQVPTANSYGIATLASAGDTDWSMTVLQDP